MNSLTHFNDQGNAHMVDVSDKSDTERVATATGRIRMRPETLRVIAAGQAKKGDVLAIARIAAITAAKKTSDLIPSPVAKRGIRMRFRSSNSCVP